MKPAEVLRFQRDEPQDRRTQAAMKPNPPLAMGQPRPVLPAPVLSPTSYLKRGSKAQLPTNQPQILVIDGERWTRATSSRE